MNAPVLNCPRRVISVSLRSSPDTAGNKSAAQRRDCSSCCWTASTGIAVGEIISSPSSKCSGLSLRAQRISPMCQGRPGAVLSPSASPGAISSMAPATCIKAKPLGLSLSTIQSVIGVASPLTLADSPSRNMLQSVCIRAHSSTR